MGEWEDVAPVPFTAAEEPPQQHDTPPMDKVFRP